jgi:glycosyltransferase involved in cell wall biosynthesis
MDNIIKFGYIGRITPEKGLDLILKALFDYKYTFEFEIYIAGSIDSSYAKNLKSTYKEKNIKWIGWVDNRNKEDFFKKIDCILVISNCIENGPLTMYEALYYKKPLIITNTPNIQNIIYDDKNGLLTKYNDHFDLHINIKKMFKIINENNKFFDYNIFKVKNTSEYCNDIEKIYKDIIND